MIERFKKFVSNLRKLRLVVKDTDGMRTLTPKDSSNLIFAVADSDDTDEVVRYLEAANQDAAKALLAVGEMIISASPVFYEFPADMTEDEVNRTVEAMAQLEIEQPTIH